MLIFTNFRLDECTDVRNNNDSGFGSLREAIICAPAGGTVTIEYPVFGQTIQLQSPLVIDKNITIKGFSSPNLFIDGSNLSTPVLDIAVGKSVNIEGISVTCAEGNINGRCVISRGHLSLGFTEFNDNVAQSSGSSIYITSGGMMTLKYSNQISN